jgi:hypothetical protein
MEFYRAAHVSVARQVLLCPAADLFHRYGSYRTPRGLGLRARIGSATPSLPVIDDRRGSNRGSNLSETQAISAKENRSSKRNRNR